MTETLTMPVRYRPDIEQIPADERETIKQLGDTSLETQDLVLRKSGSAKRATHAKATGLLKGELVIAEGLPAELAQGLFARPGRYDALIRYAQGPSENLSDKASGQRGMSIKVLGVDGPHIAESRESTTQDWLLAPGATFTNSNAKTFLSSFRPGASQAPHLPQGVIIAASRAARVTEAALETVGLGNPNLTFFGRPPRHPASDTYYSQAPVRFGEYIAKVAAFPTQATLDAIGEPLVDTDDDNAFRHAMVAFFAHNSAEFEIRVQLCTDTDAMPLDDAGIEWPEDQSPYRTVARLFLPRQNAYTEERRKYFDERLAFNPAHALEEHRPLGSIMRARMQVYMRTQDFRQHSNGAAPAEPRSHADVPD